MRLAINLLTLVAKVFFLAVTFAVSYVLVTSGNPWLIAAGLALPFIDGATRAWSWMYRRVEVQAAEIAKQDAQIRRMQAFNRKYLGLTKEKPRKQERRADAALFSGAASRRVH
jgi:hypothetical protein